MTTVTCDSQAGTRDGELPPWEVAKAVAFHEVLSDVAQLLDTPAAELVGMRIDEYIRRLLDNEFCHAQLHESPAHFMQRMQKVEDFTNSTALAAEGGRGLWGLAKSLRERCEEVVRRGGARLPK